MIKKLKAMVSRLRCVSFLKTQAHRKIVIGLKRPEFDKHEKVSLIDIAKTSAWVKLRLTSHSDVFYHTVVNGVSDDFRRGYLECFATLDDTIRALADAKDQKDIDDEDITISMQGLEEEDESSDF